MSVEEEPPDPHRETLPGEPVARSGSNVRQRDVFEAGEVVGRIYEIRKVLGAGGMGQVFEAQDHSLNRRVAIKAAWPDLEAPPLRDEARAMAAFRHSTLVTVHGIGVHRGIDYIVMERIYGVSLEELINQRRYTGQVTELQEALHVLALMAEGLAVVHRAGIAHRDVKPGNVMITPDHRVVLMDFGLFLPEFDMASQEFIAGSPPYMASEALSNKLGPGSGPLVDIYALGVTAFELLTGELPRDAATLEELFELHDLPPRALRLLRPEVPEGLEALIEEMLAKEPGERPQSAEAIGWMLRRFQAGRTSTPSSQEIVVRTPRVLVVDDDPDIARVLGFYVRRALGDVEIQTASDGEEALAMLRASPPDLMLLDLHLPKLNGIEVCMHMRGERIAEGTEVISVSAGAAEHDRQLLHQLGIRHVLTKGSDLQEQLAKVVRSSVALSLRRAAIEQ